MVSEWVGRRSRLQLGLIVWLCSRLSWLGARALPFLVRLWHHHRKSRFQAKYGAPDPGLSHLQAWAQTSAAVDRSAAFQPPQMLTQTLRTAKSKAGQEGQNNKELLETSQSSREALSSNGKQEHGCQLNHSEEKKRQSEQTTRERAQS